MRLFPDPQRQGDIKFVFLNTCSREFGFDGQTPDLKYLEKELIPTDEFTKAVVVIHVPPDNEDFDQKLTEEFYETISEYDNVLFTAHGHLHNFETYTQPDKKVKYINVYGVEYRKYVTVTIDKTEFKLNIHEF